VTRLKKLLSSFQSIKVFGNEFVLNNAAGRDAEESIKLFRKEIQEKLDGLSTQQGVSEKHQRVIDAHFPEAHKLKMRSTIHVPDMLFADTLYQLIDYYPESEGRHGRIFSIRYGIIGKAWRLRKSQWALNWIDPDGKKEESLVDEWGMTKEEAQKDIGEKRSSASLILYGVKGNPVGILYVESPSETAFGNPADQATLEKQILQTATVQQLIGALDIINKEIMAGPRIHIFDTAQTGNR
jgi:hypothetical protein